MNKIKLNRYLTTGILATGTLLLVSASSVQATPNVVVAAFATGTQGENSAQDGSYGQYNGDCLTVPYGGGTIGWDGITYDAADGSTGSAYINCNFSSADNQDVLVSMAPGYNNWYYQGGSGAPGWGNGTVDGTQYHAVQFDLLWDNTSDLTIDQFNTGDNWPAAYLNAGEGPNFMATNTYYTDGINVEFFSGNNGGSTYVGTFQIPAGASSGWQTVTVPYSDGLNGISAVAGVWFQASFGGGSGINGGPYRGSFWIDNLQLIGNVTVSGPPTVNPPTVAVPGLNIFNSTEGNSFYDRNEVLAKTTTGLSWVGNTPTSYSFNLGSFPKGGAYGGEGYMFLVPNSAYQDGGADYNEPNTMVLEVQNATSGGQASLSYKVNNPDSETYTAVTFNSFSGGPNPPATSGTAVPTTQIAGNYTLTFTGNDAGTVTAPDGTTGSFTLPASLAETYFAENGSEPYNFLMYLGSQANAAAYMNQAVVYDSVTVTGPANGAAVSENFVADANAPTPALQNWAASWSGGATANPSAVTLVPSSGAPYWVSWNLPASGFSLIDSSVLPTTNWNAVGTYTSIPMFGIDNQLVSTADLQSPAGNQYFAMIHRTFSKLLILLPGQTIAPGTALGYTGTPTPVNGVGGGPVPEDVTVIAVDANNNPVAGSTDSIECVIAAGSDGGALLPNNELMVNGTITFSLSNSPYLFSDPGTWTITAQDASNPAITAGTSASVVVNN